MAEEKDALGDPRIAALVELFATRSVTGSVSFPDGLVVRVGRIAAVPLTPPSQLTDEEIAKYAHEERREHYSAMLGRPVTDGDLKVLP